MNSEQVGGLIRAAGACVGGYVLGAHLVDSDTFNTIVGSLATLGMAIWSVYTNQSSRLADKPK